MINRKEKKVKGYFVCWWIKYTVSVSIGQGLYYTILVLFNTSLYTIMQLTVETKSSLEWPNCGLLYYTFEPLQYEGLAY